MATDYVLFIHGVNTRYEREQPNYADQLIQRIKHNIGEFYNLKPIAFYWGDINEFGEKSLSTKLQDKNGCWEQLWFKKFRETTLLQFVGDAALYISRTVGSRVVEKLNQQMIDQGLDSTNSLDRLHLVTHSWGTVILFDILFAARWDDQNIPGYQSAMAIRNRFYGVNPSPKQGIRLASIHTMGSPIALFSLLDVVKGEEQAQGLLELTENQARQRARHDITPQLRELLKNLGEKLNGNKLAWCNYIHPGDPLAWPLNPLIYSLVDGCRKVVNLEDFVITKLSFFETLMLPLSQLPITALLNGGQAHASYWNSTQVAQEIVGSIQQVAEQHVTA